MERTSAPTSTRSPPRRTALAEAPHARRRRAPSPLLLAPENADESAERHRRSDHRRPARRGVAAFAGIVANGTGAFVGGIHRIALRTPAWTPRPCPVPPGPPAIVHGRAVRGAAAGGSVHIRHRPEA